MCKPGEPCKSGRPDIDPEVDALLAGAVNAAGDAMREYLKSKGKTGTIACLIVAADPVAQVKRVQSNIATESLPGLYAQLYAENLVGNAETVSEFTEPEDGDAE